MGSFQRTEPQAFWRDSVRSASGMVSIHVKDVVVASIFDQISSMLRSACRRRIRLPPMLSGMMPTPTVVPQRRLLTTDDAKQGHIRLKSNPIESNKEAARLKASQLSIESDKEAALESSSDTTEVPRPGYKYWCAMSEFDEPDPSLSLEATSMEDLIETVAGIYGFKLEEFAKNQHSIEVYYHGQWLPVVDIEDLRKYQDDGSSARIRVPKLYEAGDYQNEHAAEDFSLPHEKVNYVVETLIESMHKQGWTPKAFIDFNVDGAIDNLTMIRIASGAEETICTKKLVLRFANVDDDLREMLVRRVGALDHIVECLHYSFSWNTHPKIGLKTLQAQMREHCENEDDTTIKCSSKNS